MTPSIPSDEPPCHLCVTTTREEADAMLAKAWTLVCSAEDRAYTPTELEELIASCTAALTKLKDVSDTIASSAKHAMKGAEARRPNKVDKHRIDHGSFVRTSGDVRCKICGHLYYDHPVVAGFEWLHRACDGRLLKL